MKYLSGLFLLGCVFIGFAQDNRFSQPDLPGELMVDVGLNTWSEMPAGTSSQTWASKSVGLYYVKRKPMGNKLSFYYGLGLGLEKIGLGDSSTLISLDETLIEPLSSDFQSIDKNKLAITYVDIPLDLRFHPKGTQDGEGFFVGAGVIGGFRVSAHTKWKYEQGGQTKRQKISGNFDLNSFRYGYQFRLGFKGVHIFYKQYLSDMFDNEIGGVNPRMRTIGINVTGF